METERRILRSTTILFSANLVSQLANFGFVILFARAYSPALFGEYSFALSLGSLLALFVSLGTNGLLFRKCSRDPTEWQPHAGLLLPWQLLLATTTWLAAIGVSVLMGAHGIELRIIAIITLFQLLNALWALFVLGFSATERMGHSAIADAGGRILILLVGAVTIWLGTRVEWILLIFPLSALLVLFILARLASAEFGKPQLRFEIQGYFSLLREALPFFGIVALAIVYGRIGILLLRTTNSAEEVGVFAVAERLVMAAGILYATFAQAIYPPIVRLFAEDNKGFHRLVNQCARLTFLLTLPIATVLHLFAEDLVEFLFGARYRTASGVLQLVAWLIAMRGITVIMNHVGIASDNQRLVFYSNLVGVLVLVVSAVALTPSQGAIGLAISALLAQGVKSLLTFLLLRPTGLLPDLGSVSLPVIAACAATMLLAALLEDNGFLIRFSGVLVVGITLLYVFRAIRTQDFEFAYRILSTRNSVAATEASPFPRQPDR